MNNYILNGYAQRLGNAIWEIDHALSLAIDDATTPIDDLRAARVLLSTQLFKLGYQFDQPKTPSRVMRPPKVVKV